MENAIAAVGVSDLVEVRFHENRANGQSKGFCVITVGSEASARQCMDKLPKKELHGQNPMVTFTSKQALNQVWIFTLLVNLKKQTCIPVEPLSVSITPVSMVGKLYATLYN